MVLLRELPDSPRVAWETFNRLVDRRYESKLLCIVSRHIHERHLRSIRSAHHQGADICGHFPTVTMASVYHRCFFGIAIHKRIHFSDWTGADRLLVSYSVLPIAFALGCRSEYFRDTGIRAVDTRARYIIRAYRLFLIDIHYPIARSGKLYDVSLAVAYVVLFVNSHVDAFPRVFRGSHSCLGCSVRVV